MAIPALRARGWRRIVGATLLAEASEPLRRMRDYHACIRTLAGQAPVTKRSGKSCFVQRRLACNKRLANAMYHWARVAAMVRSAQQAALRRTARPRLQPWQDVAAAADDGY